MIIINTDKLYISIEELKEAIIQYVELKHGPGLPIIDHFSKNKCILKLDSNECVISIENGNLNSVELLTEEENEQKITP